MRVFTKRQFVLFTLVILFCSNSYSFSSIEKVGSNLSQLTVSTKQPTDFNDRTLESFVEKYQLAIEEIESQDGAYGSRLTQELINLGSIYQKYSELRYPTYVHPCTNH
ncbi:MAG: hypothetical protein HRT37_03995 [Alteromonadaceae bacterium]|nr:hypothetical protein [Alteromonadaceae bacterium]